MSSLCKLQCDTENESRMERMSWISAEDLCKAIDATTIVTGKSSTLIAASPGY